jgi:hypothetical protein
LGELERWTDVVRKSTATTIPLRARDVKDDWELIVLMRLSLRGLAWLVIVCSIVGVGCDSRRTYRIPLAPNEKLDQQIAIRLSREVIRQAGYQPTDFELFPIRESAPPEARYFGTGPAQPPHGYVMWKSTQPSRGRFGLTVTIELQDGNAVCTLGWWK